MSYFAGRRDSDSDVSTSDSDSDDRLESSPQQLEAVQQNAAPKKKHAFLKSTTEAEGNDGDRGGEDKVQSKMERCVENIDDMTAALVQARGAKDWRTAYEKWAGLQDDLKYVAANTMKLPYSFLSTLQDTKDYFDANPLAELREAAPRENRKQLADLHMQMMAACDVYKIQIERMDESDEESDEEGDQAPMEGAAVFREGEAVTEEIVAKKLPDIRAQHGKKGANRQLYVIQLTEVFNRTEHLPKVQAYIASLLVSAYLDSSRKAGALSPNKWTSAAKYLGSLIELMSANRKDVVEMSPQQLAKRKQDVEDPFLITATVSALSTRMLEEYFDGVRSTEVYSDTYLQWLKIESTLVKLLQQARGIYQAAGASGAENVVDLTMSLLELVYYRKQEDHYKLILKYGTVDIIAQELRATVMKLNDYIQKNSLKPEHKLYASLCVIYHLALHQKLDEATRNFSNGRITEKIAAVTDAATRLMYNRVLAQLAICYFRCGNVHDAGQTVLNLYSLPKYKELLGQTQPRPNPKDKIEKALKARFVPWHMHVNTEILDVVFFLYCMIYRSKDNRLYVFRSFLMAYERQQFLGPPENSREHVYAAVKAYRKADWETAEQHIQAVPCWGAFGDDRSFLKPVTQTIKLESLKNFLMHTRGSYVNISTAHLSAKFQLDADTIRAVITKMLLNREISGVWDAAEEFLYLESSGYSVVEQSILDLADKATMLTEFSERVQDPRDGAQQGGRGGGRGHGGSRAPVARQLSAKNPFGSLRGGAATGGNKNWKK